MASLYPKKDEEDGDNGYGSLPTTIPPRAYFGKDRRGSIKIKQHFVSEEEEQESLLQMGKPLYRVPKQVDAELAELIYQLFAAKHHNYTHRHPTSSPKLPPEKRCNRHRNFYVYELNQFRHWWKTSRLLTRLAGGFVFCLDELNWATMALYNVAKRKQARHALKFVKYIGRGGVIKAFLKLVHPFTRSIRIVLAVARTWEAKVDNRLYEVGLAEGMAFIGNRCSRYWARQLADWIAAALALPFAAAFLAPHLDQNSRPMIVLMGFLRAILPFAASFQGSRFGRQVTYNTYNLASYRWRPVQSIMKFHELAGTYQDTNLDPELLALARKVAECIGHGTDPTETRNNLIALGFAIFGSGCGGLLVYRKMNSAGKLILLYVTPYGPSILDEMPRYIMLERRPRYYASRLDDLATASMLDAATPREARVQGYTYSGAFFQSQEWAALKDRHDRELYDYSNACRIMRTERLPANKRNPQQTHQPAPPSDLASLKAFVRSGRQNFKQRRDDKRWSQLQVQVNKMSKLVAKYQKDHRAPTQVILYLEGLDCAGKSSTGMLICQALEQCGYSVKVAQHNTPPTDEQKKKPWMDRIRFEYPEDMYDDPSDVPEYASLVWDRGPVGDFVYGNFSDLPLQEKLRRYEEFRTYDYNCRAEGVLFCKVFFVTDKDSIASTLGKRLAHKKIVADLRTWLDANSIEQFREGLEEIELHIDPTDFVAFNKYEENLKKFSEVARNTDYVGHVAGQEESSVGYNNPWIVVNTSNRHSARLNILKAFYRQLKRFAVSPYDRITAFDQLALLFGRVIVDDVETRHVPSNIVEEKEHGVSFRAVAQSLVLLALFCAYAHQTWKIDIEDIT